MARFHVYRLKQDGALVLAVQSDLLSSLQTCAVVPLIHKGELSPVIARLNPNFQIDGHFYTMATQFIGVVPVSELASDVVDLTGNADAITAATDFLFQGF
ncbi:CcdB family protein [Pararhizobium sp. BT-229]|uniref:CcdB family protein n=1 Tax=Pararhizobium sp. BT-229 TaxID=2986923 RepID=UPI0021F77C9A|nr:CcdB family protein [Pararhizobium sp. BT-229]MCV9962149.1 CcdB family protein [Pararhizobium sp. BT-229]